MSVEKELVLRIQKSCINDVELCISVNQIRQGIIKEVGCRNYSVLLAIASFMDDVKRRSSPNVEDIADITGLSKPTVIKAIHELEEVEIAGKPIIKKAKIPTSTGYAKSIYYFQSEVIPENQKILQQGM